MSRARHEYQIKTLDYHLAGTTLFSLALTRVMGRGLSWFTDEQIAEIRAEMIERQWFRHKLNRENRRRRANQERAA
jgi:hypothetical protein